MVVASDVRLEKAQSHSFQFRIPTDDLTTVNAFLIILKNTRVVNKASIWTIKRKSEIEFMIDGTTSKEHPSPEIGHAAWFYHDFDVAQGIALNKVHTVEVLNQGSYIVQIDEIECVCVCDW